MPKMRKICEILILLPLILSGALLYAVIYSFKFAVNYENFRNRWLSMVNFKRNGKYIKQGINDQKLVQGLGYLIVYIVYDEKSSQPKPSYNLIHNAPYICTRYFWSENLIDSPNVKNSYFLGKIAESFQSKQNKLVHILLKDDLRAKEWLEYSVNEAKFAYPKLEVIGRLISYKKSL